MTEPPPPVPENATPIPSVGLVNRMRGHKFMAIMFSPLAVAFVGLGAYAFVEGLLGAKSGDDWLALVCATVIFGPVIALGIARPVWRLYAFSKRMEQLAPYYEARAIVLSPDYIEIFTGVMHENTNDYYSKRREDVVRVPWSEVSSVHVARIPASHRTWFRGLVVAADSLPKQVNGEIQIELRHFADCEPELLAWIAHYRGGIPPGDLTQA